MSDMVEANLTARTLWPLCPSNAVDEGNTDVGRENTRQRGVVGDVEGVDDDEVFRQGQGRLLGKRTGLRLKQRLGPGPARSLILRGPERSGRSGLGERDLC